MIKKIRKSLKAQLRRLFNLPEKAKNLDKQYGIDPWVDIERLSKELKRPIEVVFDVGAHTGSTSDYFLQAYPKAKVFAFEPHGPSFNKLTSSVRNRNFNSFKIALSDSIGEQSFFEYGIESTINSLVPNAVYATRFNKDAQEKSVRVDTIDHFCKDKNVRHISVLKIDTEGNDFNVLKGAKSLLEEGGIDFILFEFNDFGTRKGAIGGSLNEIGNFLSKYNFHFIATYTDYIVTKGDLFVVANALVVRS